MRAVDVLIVGGGPAGLAVGLVFARQGFQTLICERKRFPVDKVCGEGVLPTGVARLHSLGVAKHIPSADFHPFKGILYRSNQGIEARADFQEGVGWGITRLALSRAFLSRCAGTENLEICQGSRARIIERYPERTIVECNGERIIPRLLVGADGIHSQVRRWAGLEGGAPTFRRWGIRQHFRVNPWNDYVEVHWMPGVEAYITPGGPNIVGVTFLVSQEYLRKYFDGKQLFEFLLKRFPVIEERLWGKRPEDCPQSTGPMQHTAVSPVADGVLLVGDAAGYLDAITGEGISLALAQSMALEQTVLPGLKNRMDSGSPVLASDLMPYAQAYQALVKSNNRMTRLVLILARYPHLNDKAIAVLKRFPKLFQLLLSYNMR